MSEAVEKAQEQAAGAVETSDFSSLLKKEFKPQTDRMAQDVEDAVATLAQQAA